MPVREASAQGPAGADSMNEVQQSEQLAGGQWATLVGAAAPKHHLGPSRAILVFTAIAMAPIVLWSIYGVLPRAARMHLQQLSAGILLLAIAGSSAVVICLLMYRAHRQFSQFRLNASLTAAPPDEFVLYLRSFRQTGAVVVRNHVPRLADRWLLGNFWDVELALSLSLKDKLSVVAVGSKATSLGTAKFITDDSNWQVLVRKLAETALAIVIVPDDRAGTLWELQLMLGTPDLRRKTVVVMPPEQFGWLRRLRRLPRIEDSWERVRDHLASTVQLPPYSPEGGFLFSRGARHEFAKLDLADFQTSAVQETVALAIRSHVEIPLADPSRELPDSKDDWRALLNPVWPLATVVAFLFADEYASSSQVGVSDYVIFASTIALPALLCLLLYSAAYTKEVEARAFDSAADPAGKAPPSGKAGFSWRMLEPSHWLGLRLAPGLARASLDTLVTLVAISMFRELVVEPYRVPSGSMMPTLQIGDLVAVNRHRYGVRIPFTSTKITRGQPVARGDVIAFHYPPEPKTVYIKRVVARGGDEIVFRSQRLSVNGMAVPAQPLASYFDEDQMRYIPRLQESMSGVKYEVLVDDSRAFAPQPEKELFKHVDMCRFDSSGMACRVPAGHYFVMGDNRDNSRDSRYWGFVPEAAVIGPVTTIWMNASNLSRIGPVR